MPTRTKILSTIAGALLIALCISHGEMMLPLALAEDKVVPDVQGEIMGKLLYVIGTLNVAAFLALKLVSYLSNPSVIFGIDTNTGILLHMWQISRDIMNLIFAILLLGGAIMTIVFAKQDIIKQNLVKFLLAVVLVNFSWFFPRVIIDIANVTTATIYNLPHIVTAGTTLAPPGAGTSIVTLPCVWRDGSGNPRDCMVMTDIIFAGSTATCPPSAAVDPAPLDLTIAKVCFTNYDPGANTAFGIINGLVLNHGRLMHLGLIVGAPPGGGAGATVQDTLYFGFVISLLAFLHLMLVFPIVALATVMLVRIPILWLTISFMPFMFIGFLIGDKFIKVNTMQIFQKHFLVAAFLPALIAVPFSIGFIMLNAFATLYPSAPPGLGEPFDVVAEVHSWWDLVWVLISFMVIWIGTRWAMKSDEIYAKFTEPIYNTGSSFLKLPLNVPFIPHDTNKNGVTGDAGDRRFSISEMLGNSQRTGLPFGLPGQNNQQFPQGGQGNNPNAQRAANELNNKGLKKEDFDQLGNADVKLDEVKELLKKIHESVQSNTGTSRNLNVTLDVIQKAANAQNIQLSNAQIEEIKQKLRQDGHN